MDKRETEVKDLPIEIGIKLTIKKSTESVEIKGSWDNWTTGIPMKHFEGTHETGNFTYLAKFQVPQANKSYEYKFIVEGEWITDESKPQLNGNNYFEVAKNADKHIYFNNLCLLRKYFIEISEILNTKYPFIFYSHYEKGFLSVMRENASKDSFYFLVTRTALDKSNDPKVY